MKHKFQKPLMVLTALALTGSMLAACSAAAATDETRAQTSSAAVSSASQATAADAASAQYDESNTTSISLKGSTATVDGAGASVDGSTLKITAAGTYIVRGSLQGNVTVDAPEAADVTIVLDGAEIESDDTAPMYFENADNITVVLADGSTNTVTDSRNSPSAEEEEAADAPSAAIVSNIDLTFRGGGSLRVSGGYDKGINTKDDLVFEGGEYTIQSTGHAVRGHDSITVLDGTFHLESEKDGLHSDYEDADDKGWIQIDGGSFTINTPEDDAIHAENAIMINGGEITVTACYEGIEAKAIDINGGNINITASDDAINASDGSDAQTGGFGGPGAYTAGCYINFSGGTVTLNAAGDGIDSNGDVTMSGGEVYVSGPTSGGDGALDYDGTFPITGGTLVAAGSSGMAMAPDDTSTQGVLMVYFTETQKAGTSAELKDENGKTLATYTPEKDYQSIVISATGMVAGGTYTLETNGEKLMDVTLSSVVTIVSDTGEAVQGGMGMGGALGGRGTPPDGQGGLPPFGG